MDVRIGEITTDIDVTDEGGMDDLALERIARRVMALIERRERAEERARSDRAIESPDRDDTERYG